MRLSHIIQTTSIRNFWLKEDPSTYLGHPERTGFLVSKISGLAVSDILEIGCNCGRNLEGLGLSRKYRLFGIELNKKAIDLMKLYHPETYKDAAIINTSVNELDLSVRQFDLVFTMAVLEHIKDISFLRKIKTKYFITMEDERGKSRWWYFKRNYKEVFEQLGFRQLEEQNLEGIIDNNFTYRLFRAE